MSANSTAIELRPKRELVVSDAPENPIERRLLRAIADRMASKGRLCRLETGDGKISLVAV